MTPNPSQTTADAEATQIAERIQAAYISQGLTPGSPQPHQADATI